MGRRGVPPSFPDADVPAIVARLAAGERSDDVAAPYGIQGDSLRTTLRRRGILVPPPPRRAPHGTRTRYGYGCTCELCRAANTESARQLRARRRTARALSG